MIEGDELICAPVFHRLRASWGQFEDSAGQELREARRPRPLRARQRHVKGPRYINAIDSVRSELAVPLMLQENASACWIFRAATSITSRATSKIF